MGCRSGQSERVSRLSYDVSRDGGNAKWLARSFRASCWIRRIWGSANQSMKATAPPCFIAKARLTLAFRVAGLIPPRGFGDEVVYVSARLKDVVSSAAQLHGWNQ